MNQTPRDLEIPFDRITYREGQLLASRDLQDDVERDQRLRGLHTSYLHETWGIALGFEVQAAVGSASVRAGPGYAIDSSGRELLLAESLDIPVPVTQVEAALVLVINYQEDAAFRTRPGTGGVCLGGGLDPRKERPVFTWRTVEQVEFGPDVPLVLVRVQNGALVSAPERAVRKHAARAIRPHIGFGSDEIVSRADGLLRKFDVNTTDAGFTRTPYYFAKLTLEEDPRLTAAMAALLTATAFIEAPSSTGFSLCTGLSPAGIGLSIATVTWIGLEPVRGCEPLLNLQLLFNLAGLFLSPFIFAVPGSIAVSHGGFS